MVLFQILWNDILPLFVFFGMGWFLDSKFKIDILTYNKLTLQVVLPGFIFYSVYLYEPTRADWLLIPSALVLLMGMYLISRFTGVVLGVNEDQEGLFRAVSTFGNAGNIGVALILMMYSHEPFLSGSDAPYLAEARGAIVILMLIMSLAVNTVGAALIGTKGLSMTAFFKTVVTMPAAWAAAAAIAARLVGFPAERTFVWPVLLHFASAFLVLVTVSVGVQLHRAHLVRPCRFVWAAAVLKLLASPLVALWVIHILGGMNPVCAQVFFIVSAIPSSITLVMYASDYDVYPSLATQSVLFNTVLGTVTMTAVIYLARLLFPAAV